MKANPSPVALKHYKDGDFHKDYDRSLSVTSMVNFLRDPSGDLPWEEDPSGADVLHIPDPDVRPTLICRYLPNDFLIRFDLREHFRRSINC